MKNRPRAIIIVSIAGIIVIAIFLLLGAFGFQGVQLGTRWYEAKTDHGYYVFYRLLQELSHNVVFTTTSSPTKKSPGVIVYLSLGEPYEIDSEGLMQQVRQGNDLLIIGALSKTFMEGGSLEEGTDLELRMNDSALSIQYPIEEPVLAKAYFSASSFQSLGDRILAETDDGVVIGRWQEKKGSITFIADPSLFINQNMRKIQNAALLASLFTRFQGKTLYLRERPSTALYNPTMLKEFFTGDLRLFVLQLLLLFLLFLYYSGKRFSRPEVMERQEKRKISQHIKAVGMFYQKAGAYALIEEVNAEYCRKVVCRGKKPAQLTDQEFDDLIAIRKNISPPESLEGFKKRNAIIRSMKRKKEIS